MLFRFSPLDEIIDQLGGPSCVAEMTGRRGRIVRKHGESKPCYQTRESDSTSVDSLNIQEVCSIYQQNYRRCKLAHGLQTNRKIR